MARVGVVDATAFCDRSMTGSDELEQVFRSNLTRIGQMVAVLDTWKEPVYLKRASGL